MADLLQRRRFLAGTAGLLAWSATGSAWPRRLGQLPRDPFTLGVASGDPTHDSVVLWTRLSPDPVDGGGMPPERVEVEWEVAEDERLSRVVRRGRETASPDLGHSIHVEVKGLEPARWYWYRFRTGAHTSRVGRTRTAPDERAPLGKLSFAFASCQHYEAGYFTAYRHMVDEEIELVVHLGDYIYEGAALKDRPRRHNSDETTTLQGYRNRYALYRLDPDLQTAHARFPWIVTWDDHEVDNNYAGSIPEDGVPTAEFLKRRAAAYQAYYEFMPLSRRSKPHGAEAQIYRRLVFGDLAEFSVLDTRQYRTDQPCGDGNKPLCPAALDPRATMLGKKQERWLLDGLSRSHRRWNIVAQQVLMAKVDRLPGAGTAYAMDQWAGYEVERNRVLGAIGERRIRNTVVLTGDIHSNWVADLKPDFGDPKSPVVATEFVGTSITSGGDGSDSLPQVDAYLPENPHVRFYNSQRGYVRCLVTPELWRTDYRVVPFVSRQGAPISTRATFVVENNHPGAKRDT